MAQSSSSVVIRERCAQNNEVRRNGTIASTPRDCSEWKRCAQHLEGIVDAAIRCGRWRSPFEKITRSGRCEQLPRSRNALQTVGSPVFKLEAGPCDQIPYGARDQHFICCSESSDARSDVNRYATEFFTDDFALAGVNPRPNANA